MAKSLFDELLAIKNQRRNQNSPRSKKVRSNDAIPTVDFMRPYSDVNALIADGKDHINIWHAAETDLGAVLDFNSPLELTHSIFGYFDNMTAFWFYMQSKERDDRLRGMNPISAVRFGRKMESTRVVNFRAIIADSNWQRIKSKPALIAMLKRSDLPFDCYRVEYDTGLRIRPPFFGWLLWATEEIRKALKEDREPDFTCLLDEHGTGIYDYVMPKNPGIKPIKPSASELQTVITETKLDTGELKPGTIPEVTVDNNSSTAPSFTAAE